MGDGVGRQLGLADHRANLIRIRPIEEAHFLEVLNCISGALACVTQHCGAVFVRFFALDRGRYCGPMRRIFCVEGCNRERIIFLRAVREVRSLDGVLRLVLKHQGDGMVLALGRGECLDLGDALAIGGFIPRCGQIHHGGLWLARRIDLDRTEPCAFLIGPEFQCVRHFAAMSLGAEAQDHNGEKCPES
jgi:hypothetical protein